MVGDIRRLFRRVLRLGELMDRPRLAGARRWCVAGSHREALTALARCVDEAQAVGVQVRDFELGLIAFPADPREGVGMLSWRAGEAAVTHGHGEDEPAEARRPLRMREAVAA